MEDVFDRFLLTGRTAIVTGGAGLLGSEFCRTLAKAGAAVAVLDLNLERAEAVAAEIRGQGRRADAVAGDVSSPESLRDALRRISEMGSEEEILVHSAAMDPKFDPQHR